MFPPGGQALRALRTVQGARPRPPPAPSPPARTHLPLYSAACYLSLYLSPVLASRHILSPTARRGKPPRHTPLAFCRCTPQARLHAPRPRNPPVHTCGLSLFATPLVSGADCAAMHILPSACLLALLVPFGRHTLPLSPRSYELSKRSKQLQAVRRIHPPHELPLTWTHLICNVHKRKDARERMRKRLGQACMQNWEQNHADAIVACIEARGPVSRAATHAAFRGERGAAGAALSCLGLSSHCLPLCLGVAAV